MLETRWKQKYGRKRGRRRDEEEEKLGEKEGKGRRGGGEERKLEEEGERVSVSMNVSVSECECVASSQQAAPPPKRPPFRQAQRPFDAAITSGCLHNISRLSSSLTYDSLEGRARGGKDKRGRRKGR